MAAVSWSCFSQVATVVAMRQLGQMLVCGVARNSAKFTSSPKLKSIDHRAHIHSKPTQPQSRITVCIDAQMKPGLVLSGETWFRSVRYQHG